MNAGMAPSHRRAEPMPFLTGEDPEEARAMLSLPAVRRRLEERVGSIVGCRAMDDRPAIWWVTGSAGEVIVRFASSPSHLEDLRREERVQRHLRPRVDLALPDAEVVEATPRRPAFAVHHAIAGDPLTEELYASLTAPARDRLVADLAGFLSRTHAIPPAEACGWLGVPYQGDDTLASLAATAGKLPWFAPAGTAAMRRTLVAALDQPLLTLFDETVARFAALTTHPEWMVFGHGDLHGYNMAMVDDVLGPRLAGVFDLGNTGILDLHEDLFRLNLVSHDLLTRVVAAYERETERARPVDTARIEIYYRVFLFYLMEEKALGGDAAACAQLQRMLADHVAGQT